MQDNFDKAFRDKLAGYQAPADPMDWAAMSAALDAQDSKRRGFFWWWVLGIGLIATTGVITYEFWNTGNGTDTEIANTPATQVEAGHEAANNTATGAGANAIDNDNDVTDEPSTDAGATGNVAANGLGGKNNNQPENNSDTGNGAVATNASSDNGGASSNSIAGGDNPTKKGTKKGKANSSVASHDGASTTADGDGQNPNNKSKAGRITKGNGGVSASTNGAAGSSTIHTANTGYEREDLSASINLKQLKQLPNNMEMAFKKDSSDISYKMLKAKAFSHYLGIGTGWVTSRVDRSGDLRSGYNVGMQYGLMYKNRVGLNVGLAFRQYNYFTDLVACNYEIYQCPTNYSSEVRVVDFYVGAQVNLVKTEKVDWYIMGGINNQFMLEETFDYSLPVVDTPSVPNLPVEPPRNTSFTGGGSSDFSESISESQDFLSTGSVGNPTGEGKFLRERFIGGWYVGTGITYRFVPRMSLQVEPVFGRTSQFVGIQDKKLWSTGVNVRLNVRLGR